MNFWPAKKNLVVQKNLASQKKIGQPKKIWLAKKKFGQPKKIWPAILHDFIENNTIGAQHMKILIQPYNFLEFIISTTGNIWQKNKLAKVIYFISDQIYFLQVKHIMPMPSARPNL